MGWRSEGGEAFIGLKAMSQPEDRLHICLGVPEIKSLKGHLWDCTVCQSRDRPCIRGNEIKRRAFIGF